MHEFRLHPRLAEDSHHLGRLDNSQVLLMRNAHFPWFVLVPETGAREFHHLAAGEQQAILQQINNLSYFIEHNFSVDKLNVACIGNLVPQMHLHVVGRRRDDICWPNVVWGVKEFRAYEDPELAAIRENFQAHLRKQAHS